MKPIKEIPPIHHATNYAELRREEMNAFLESGEQYAQLKRFKSESKIGIEINSYKQAFKGWRFVVKFHQRANEIYIERLPEEETKRLKAEAQKQREEHLKQREIKGNKLK